MSVGGEGEGVSVGEEGVSVGVDGGEGALREEHDVLGVESEVVVVGEELASGLVIDFGGHDVPGDDAAVLLLVAEDAFGEELEEALVLEFGDGVGALGGVVAESCSLSAGFPALRSSAPWAVACWRRVRSSSVEGLRLTYCAGTSLSKGMSGPFPAAASLAQAVTFCQLTALSCSAQD